MTPAVYKKLLVASVSACTMVVCLNASAEQLGTCDKVAATALGELTKEMILDAGAQQSNQGNVVVSPAGFLELTNLFSHNASDGLKVALKNTSHIDQAGECMHSRLDAVEIQSGTQNSYNLVLHQSGFEPTKSLSSAVGISDDANTEFIGEVLALPQKDLSGWTETQNSRLSDQLGGMIENPIEVDPSTNFLIANLLAFKSPWKDAFDPDLTHQASFTQEDGKSIDVAMMKRDEVFVYLDQQNGFTRVLLPFENEDYVIQLILPPEGFEPAAWADNLDPSWLVLRQGGSAGAATDQEFIWPGTVQTIGLELPRFTAEAQNDLRPMVTKLGLGGLFSNADLLSGLFTPSQRLDDMMQTLAFRADETGAEAAAVSVAASSRAMVAGPEIIKFDRPFLFTLNHLASGSVLFAGSILSPDQWTNADASKSALTKSGTAQAEETSGLDPSPSEQGEAKGFWNSLKKMIVGIF